MKTQNKQNGITLVALVITIIILLILAGISISALTNQGLFAKAQQAKQESENAQREENEILTDYLEQMEVGYWSGNNKYISYTVNGKRYTKNVKVLYDSLIEEDNE